MELNHMNITKMRKAGKLVRSTFDYLEFYLRPGISTGQLDKLANDYITFRRGIPAPLGYPHQSPLGVPFPKSICTSVNNCLAHGVPRDDEILQEGDIISIDISLSIDGFFGDACRTYPIGKVSAKADQFVHDVKQIHCMLIDFTRENSPYITTGDIGWYTEVLADLFGVYVFEGYGGHGIGAKLHQNPFVPPVGTQGSGPTLKPGSFITIEPIFASEPTTSIIGPDQWSVICPPGVLTAQFEHTIHIKPSGIEILT